MLFIPWFFRRISYVDTCTWTCLATTSSSYLNQVTVPQRSVLFEDLSEEHSKLVLIWHRLRCCPNTEVRLLAAEEKDSREQLIWLLSHVTLHLATYQNQNGKTCQENKDYVWLEFVPPLPDKDEVHTEASHSSGGLRWPRFTDHITDHHQ